MPNAAAKAPAREFANSLVQAFLNSGLTITICPTRNLKPKTFGRKGAISHRGRKIENFRAMGYAKANGC